MSINPYWIIIGFSSLVQFAMFLRWLHRRTRDDEIQRAFVHAMAVNHLPHIYHALQQIANHLRMELEEPPSVQFIDLNDHNPKP
jgi:hypothetical protein